MDERKGLDSLIQLSKILDDNYRIIIVGLSEEQVSQIPSNIYVVKATNDVEELAELYAIADYFVNPTYEDNYPTTNLEAISVVLQYLHIILEVVLKVHCCMERFLLKVI